MIGVATDVQSAVLAQIQPSWLREMRSQMAIAEGLRARAKVDTGTLSEAAYLYLRALIAWSQAKRIVEVGTFIGTSVMAMLAGGASEIDTCDKRNDCVANPPKGVRCYPFVNSRKMLRSLDGPIDFFFFDGRLGPGDLASILTLSTKRTIYAFDDYDGDDKGVANVEFLRPELGRRELILPPATVYPGIFSRTSIAVLVPA